MRGISSFDRTRLLLLAAVGSAVLPIASCSRETTPWVPVLRNEHVEISIDRTRLAQDASGRRVWVRMDFVQPVENPVGAGTYDRSETEFNLRCASTEVRVGETHLFKKDGSEIPVGSNDGPPSRWRPAAELQIEPLVHGLCTELHRLDPPPN